MFPTLSRPSLINSLHERLILQKLPGAAAHQKMAHAIRKVDPGPLPATSRDAAVLMILFEKTPGDFHLIFIRRTSSHEGDKHAGQIGFPGGKREATDHDLMFTALREAHEEIAIDVSKIDVLGPLTPLYITVSRFMVHPFLAYSTKQPVMSRQEAEIEEIIELPLASFLLPSTVRETRIHLSPGIILNHVPCFQFDNHLIWGATAMILSEFLEILPAA